MEQARKADEATKAERDSQIIDDRLTITQLKEQIKRSQFAEESYLKRISLLVEDYDELKIRFDRQAKEIRKLHIALEEFQDRRTSSEIFELSPARSRPASSARIAFPRGS